MKHTPGPWAFRPHKERKEHFFVLENAYIGPDINALIAQVKFEANAKIIAAAPELLEALIGLNKDLNDNHGFTEERQLQVNEAIKKATS